MRGTFKISKVAGAPQFDSLPVAKITRYPLEERDYKPYAQCILCVLDDAIVLRMWAFEVSPLPKSHMRCVLYLFADRPDTALCVDLYADGAVETGTITSGGAQTAQGELGGVDAHPFSGEDLQGVYWGHTVTIPLASIAAHGPLLPLEDGTSIPGNFYKLCAQEPFVHSGSCFEADFARNPYAPEGMGELVIVSY